MRLAAQVLAAYVVLLLMTALWRLLPSGRAIPDLVALFAVYLGLSARERLAPAVLSAAVMGYLADLLMGAPTGLLAADAAFLCLVGHLIQGRLLVRGRLFTVLFSALVALVSGVLLMVLRSWVGMSGRSLSSEIGTILLVALATGVAGPLVFRLCRQVDARFARTQRERDAALEGLL